MKITLSNTEWKLMNKLWKNEPMTIMQLTHALADEVGWTKHTIITMLSRLEAKGAVYFEQGTRAKLYFAAVTREDAQTAETESFIDKVYGGRPGLLMSTLVKNRSLTPQDIEELTEILRKAGEKK